MKDSGLFADVLNAAYTRKMGRSQINRNGVVQEIFKDIGPCF